MKRLTRGSAAWLIPIIYLSIAILVAIYPLPILDTFQLNKTTIFYYSLIACVITSISLFVNMEWRYDLLIFIVLITQIFVRVEPALYDVIIPMLLVLGIFWRKLTFTNFFQSPYLFCVIYLVLDALSLLNASNPIVGIRFFLITLYLIFTSFLFTAYIRSPKEEKNIKNGYVAAASIASLLGLVGLATCFTPFLWGGTRVMALFKDPNVFGAFLIPAIAFQLVDIAGMELKNKIFIVKVLITSLLGVGVVFSYSRGTYLSFVIMGAVLILFLLMSHGKKCLKPILVTFIVTAIIVSCLLTVFGEWNFLVARLRFQNYDVRRFDTHEAAISSIGTSITQTPTILLWGSGPGYFEDFFGMSAHNTYLKVCFEDGVLALVSLCLLFFFTLMNLLRKMVRTKRFSGLEAVVFSSILGILVNSLVIDTLHWRHLWYLIGVAWACNRK